MRNFLLLFLIIACSSFGYSQTNPEDIIILIDSENPEGKVMLKSDVEKLKDKMSSDLDSLSDGLLDDKRIELLSKKDSIALTSLLVGNWKLESVERINGEQVNLGTPDIMKFTEDGRFSFIEGDTADGDWLVGKDATGNLSLTYDKPFYMISEEMMKYMPKELIERSKSSTNVYSIKEIDRDTLVLFSFIIPRTEKHDDMFYRLVLKTYSKTK